MTYFGSVVEMYDRWLLACEPGNDDLNFAEAIGIPSPNDERHGFFLPFHGITADEIDNPKARQLYAQMAPVTHLTGDDPPAWMDHSFPNTPVKDSGADLNLVVHHPLFGIALKERMDKLGIECVVQYRDASTRATVRHGSGQPPVSDVDFIRRHFEGAGWRLRRGAWRAPQRNLCGNSAAALPSGHDHEHPCSAPPTAGLSLRLGTADPAVLRGGGGLQAGIVQEGAAGVRG